MEIKAVSWQLEMGLASRDIEQWKGGRELVRAACRSRIGGRESKQTLQQLFGVTQN